MPEAGSLELWLEVVQGIIGGPTEGLSLLDLCCNECTGTSRMRWKWHAGVDVVNWPTRSSLSLFYQLDALEFLQDRTHMGVAPYDVCICSDGIEHLTKAQGLQLLTEMERVASLNIIFTPLGDYLVEPESTHPDVHRSGWNPEELEALGWTTIVYPHWHATLGVGAFFAHKGTLQA